MYRMHVADHFPEPFEGNFKRGKIEYSIVEIATDHDLPLVHLGPR